MQLVTGQQRHSLSRAGSPLDITATNRIKQTTVTGLTHPDTKFARFYAKTNTNTDHDTDKNTITAVQSVSTDTGAGTNTSTAAKPGFGVHAGLGSAGYDTVPTKAQIEANSYTIYHNAFCGEHAISNANFFHNGSSGLYPKVGDLISRKAPGGVPNYGGGTDSFISAYGSTDYFALAVGDNLDNFLRNGKAYYKIIKYIVVEYTFRSCCCL